MHVIKFKTVIWAADMARAIRFYQNALDATLTKDWDVISDIEIAGVTIGIHGGGEGKRTWTGMSFQVEDVLKGAAAVVEAGGSLTREPAPEDGEAPHLAMCMDTEGNEFMLTRKRG